MKNAVILIVLNFQYTSYCFFFNNMYFSPSAKTSSVPSKALMIIYSLVAIKAKCVIKLSVAVLAQVSEPF